MSETTKSSSGARIKDHEKAILAWMYIKVEVGGGFSERWHNFPVLADIEKLLPAPIVEQANERIEELRNKHLAISGVPNARTTNP